MSIEIKGISYIYDQGNPFETRALDQVTLTIKKGEFVGLIGHTGSGKSTLIQHLNGLLKPTEGSIFINEKEITLPKVNLNNVRKQVGLVFQYPEYQLFEETVGKDIAFGPQQLGLDPKEIEARVREAMELVGLNFEKDKDRSPFELSGGQKRRAAIAGVIAMKPEILILDEPTAGLDPIGREDVLKQIKNLHTRYGMTVILVSHSMEEIARYTERILVMDQGKLILAGTPGEVFKHVEKLKQIGLGIPQVTQLSHDLKKKGIHLGDTIFTVEQAKEALLAYVKGESNA